jgi:hypothetical protein
MQKAGLPVLRFSKWKFLRGSDLIDFIERTQTGNDDRVAARHQGSEQP